MASHGTSVSDTSVVATDCRVEQDTRASDGVSPVMASDHQQMEAVADVNLASRIVFDRYNICQVERRTCQHITVHLHWTAQWTLACVDSCPIRLADESIVG